LPGYDNGFTDAGRVSSASSLFSAILRTNTGLYNSFNLTATITAASTSSRANWIELLSAYQKHTTKMKSLDELELEKQIE